MDPSTEQLVRDYLNQVAVAARRSMGPDEVRAFLARLHGSIERQCTAQGVASMAEVSSVLAELGGPEALVDLERARLAADAAGPGSAGPDRGAGGPVAADPAAAEMQAAAAGTEPGATGAEDGPAGGAGGRILRLPTPRRLARQRDGWRTGSAGSGTDPAAEPDETAAEKAIQRRSVTARWRPATIITEKAAPRPRGPQGRDSPILHPVRQGRAGQSAAAGQRSGAQPGAAEPGAPLAFVPQPAPAQQARPTAVAKFYPVRQPAAAAGQAPERTSAGPPGSSPVRQPDRTAGSPPERPSGRAPATGRASSAGLVPSSGLTPAAGQEQVFRPEARSGPEPSSGQEPVFHHDPSAGPERVFRPESPSGQQPVRQGDAPGPWRGQEPATAVEPTGPAQQAADTRSGWERITAAIGPVLKESFAVARRHPLESVAIVLLSVGGLIFPLIWLAGAIVALPSRLWDVRDKWLGLATPAIVTIVGSAGLATGIRHLSAGAYIHGAMTIGGYLIRVSGVLGAAYLAWRVRRGQRAAAPPWRRPYS